MSMIAVLIQYTGIMYWWKHGKFRLITMYNLFLFIPDKASHVENIEFIIIDLCKWNLTCKVTLLAKTACQPTINSTKMDAWELKACIQPNR